MPFGQPHACLIAHQITVIIVRHRQPERPKQKNLPRSRLQQIRPAHDFGDAHRGIVNDHSQLVGGHIVAPPNNKIPKIAPRDKPLRSEMQIVKTNLLAIRHAKPPIHTARLRTCGDGRLGRPAMPKASGLRGLLA